MRAGLKRLGFLAWLAAGCTVERAVGRFVDGGAADQGGGRDNPMDAYAGRFATLAPGQPLPGDSECQARVRPSAWEPRPDNTPYNQRRPSAAELAQLVPWGEAQGFDERAQALGRRVSGQFTGTTDEILQWAACKWGFDEDLVRAEVTALSEWRQETVGTWTTTLDDCPPGAPTRTGRGSTECPETYGLYQIMWHWVPDTWPMVRDDTAFHVDLALGLRRVCFEGWATYLAENAPAGTPYVAGDAWGCGGADFSGNWYDRGAQTHITTIKQLVSEHPWTLPDF